MLASMPCRGGGLAPASVSEGPGTGIAGGGTDPTSHPESAGGTTDGSTGLTGSFAECGCDEGGEPMSASPPRVGGCGITAFNRAVEIDGLTGGEARSWAFARAGSGVGLGLGTAGNRTTGCAAAALGAAGLGAGVLETCGEASGARLGETSIVGTGGWLGALTGGAAAGT